MNLAYVPPSSAETNSFLIVLTIVALLIFVVLRALSRRNHTHSEFVPGDVRRDLHAIVAAIDGIPKVHVTHVDQWGGIRAKRNLSDTSIRVELRQAEPATMGVTVTIRTPGHGIHRTLIRQVMQAIYSAQERLTRPQAPFGPTVPT